MKRLGRAREERLRFDVKEFRRLKKELDPNNVLGNGITDAVLWG